MAASRRSRYDPGPTQTHFVMTPLREAPLRLLADYGLLSMPQLALLLEGQQSPKGVERTMLHLFQGRLVELVPVTRADLAGRVEASLMTGSAPNVYRLSRAGLAHLGATPAPGSRAVSPYRVAHEVFTRDIAIWAYLASRHHGLTAPHAQMNPPKMRTVRPDAVIRFSMTDGKVMVGLIETDRGTERGVKHWTAKTTGYQDLFASGALSQYTGYKAARILTVCGTPERAEKLAALVARLSPGEAFRYWFTDRSTLATTDLALPLWKNQGEFKPLLSETFLAPHEASQ